MVFLEKLIVGVLPLVPKFIVGRLSQGYIAGESLDDAVQCVKKLNKEGFRVTIDILGEFVTDFKQAEMALAGYMDVLQAIDTHQLDANISIKPTSFGLQLDASKSEDLIRALLKETLKRNNFLRLDMEDSPCTDQTIQMYEHFRNRAGSHVGVVLQAYLRRTQDDIRSITSGGASHFRLCKGIYVEPEGIAFKGYEEIRRNFLASLRLMLEKNAFVGIATHDEYLVDESERLIRELGLGPEHYEFQMLLGVREKLRDRIRRSGHNLRIYVPFGKDWYGYSMRRLQENPSLAGTIFKALVLGD